MHLLTPPESTQHVRPFSDHVSNHDFVVIVGSYWEIVYSARTDYAQQPKGLIFFVIQCL